MASEQERKQSLTEMIELIKEECKHRGLHFVKAPISFRGDQANFAISTLPACDKCGLYRAHHRTCCICCDECENLVFCDDGDCAYCSKCIDEGEKCDGCGDIACYQRGVHHCVQENGRALSGDDSTRCSTCEMTCATCDRKVCSECPIYGDGDRMVDGDVYFCTFCMADPVLRAEHRIPFIFDCGYCEVTDCHVAPCAPDDWIFQCVDCGVHFCMDTCLDAHEC